MALHGGELACGGSAHSAKKAKGSLRRNAPVSRTRLPIRSPRSGTLPTRSLPARSPRCVTPPTARARLRSSGSYGGGSTGIASYYWQGQMTASGARFNPNAMTAAHRSLPFGTRVLVTTIASGRTVTVTINDRGPFVKGRIIDLSSAAAGALGIDGCRASPSVSVSVLGRG